jgi:thioredoxin 1
MTNHSPNVHLADSLTFEAEVLRASLPVLVDFTAAWCTPCKALGRILDLIADENVGQLKVVKVDIDQAPDIAARYGVRAVPTVIAFDRGRTLAQRLGLSSKDKLLALVATDLAR